MTVGHFTNDQLAALRILHQIWSQEQIILIGASALGCFIDMRWRQTYDLDLSISISLEKYASELDHLSGWSRDLHVEQRWLAPGNVRIDIIPAGPKLLDAGELVWPESGFRMNLIGMRLAFKQAVLFRPAKDFELRVAPVSVIAVLKMIAYREKPYDRARDLLDITYIIDQFLSEDDQRRFSDEVFELGLEYEDTSAFFLGKEIRSITNEIELKEVTSFISMARDYRDPSATQSRMLSGPTSWRGDPRILLKRLDAFDKGMSLRSDSAAWSEQEYPNESQCK